MPYTTLPIFKQIMSKENREEVDRTLGDPSSSLLDKGKAVGSGVIGILKGQTNKDLSPSDIRDAILTGYARSLPLTMSAAALTGLGYRYLGGSD